MAMAPTTLVKPWYQSTALWLNIIAIALAAIGAILDAANVLQLSAQAVVYFSIAVAVLNAIVRVLSTNKPIEGTPAARSLRDEQHVQARLHAELER